MTNRQISLALLAVLALSLSALGLRALVNASTFQLFGNWVARVETTDLVVAVTFDDGPHPHHTPAVLDVLDRHQARATFFLMGRNLERHPDVAREIVRRGHEVGNHSYSHPRMRLMSRARIREEIERTDALIRRLGVTGPIHVRPPHFAKFIALPIVLSSMGKLSVLADVDPNEWRRPPADEIASAVLGRVRPGSIIGLHDTLGVETIRALERILQTLAARGYRFETVSRMVERRS